MSYREDAPREGGGMENYPGCHLLLPGATHTIYKPGEKGLTVFRPCPEFLDGREQPMEIGENNDGLMDYSDWIKPEFVAFRFGPDPGMTACARVKGEKSSVEGPIRRFGWQLFKAIRDYPEDVPPRWRKWAPSKKDDQTRAEAIGNPLKQIKCGLLMQGWLFENNGKRTKSGKGQDYIAPALLFLPESGRLAMEELLAKGGPEFVSCAKGHRLEIEFVKGDKRRLSGYDVRVGDPLGVSPKTAARLWKPWKEILRFLTPEEQMAMLIEVWGAAPVDFVFGKGGAFSDLLPTSARGAFDRLKRESERDPNVGREPGEDDEVDRLPDRGHGGGERHPRAVEEDEPRRRRSVDEPRLPSDDREPVRGRSRGFDDEGLANRIDRPQSRSSRSELEERPPRDDGGPRRAGRGADEEYGLIADDAGEAAPSTGGRSRSEPSEGYANRRGRTLAEDDGNGDVKGGRGRSRVIGDEDDGPPSAADAEEAMQQARDDREQAASDREREREPAAADRKSVPAQDPAPFVADEPALSPVERSAQRLREAQKRYQSDERK